jgi:hypothetical protein
MKFPPDVSCRRSCGMKSVVLMSDSQLVKGKDDITDASVEVVSKGGQVGIAEPVLGPARYPHPSRFRFKHLGDDAVDGRVVAATRSLFIQRIDVQRCDARLD